MTELRDFNLTDCDDKHSSHMCEIVAKRRMAQAGEIAKDAKFICHICGRAAKKAENLCEPVDL